MTDPTKKVVIDNWETYRDHMEELKVFHADKVNQQIILEASIRRETPSLPPVQDNVQLSRFRQGFFSHSHESRSKEVPTIEEKEKNQPK